MAKKHIRLITPHISPRPEKLEGLEHLRRDDLEFSQVRLDFGPSSIECEYDDALASPYIVGRAMEAEGDGADAVIIDCMGDPGLHAARELVRIPVLGAGETSMHVAAMLGHAFSIITIMDRVRPILERHIRVSGLASRLASTRVVETSVLDINENLPELFARLSEEALIAVTEDKADVILLGCTGFLGCAEAVADALERTGHSIPVIDPLPTTVMFAAGLLDAGLTHSLATYPLPPHKARTGYAIPNFSITEQNRES